MDRDKEPHCRGSGQKSASTERALVTKLSYSFAFLTGIECGTFLRGNLHLFAIDEKAVLTDS